MKRTLLLVTVLTALLFSACSKENSFEDPNSVPGGDTTGTGGGGTTTPPTTPPASSTGLLVRLTEVSGSDSNSSVYTYDAAKRLVRLQLESTQGVTFLQRITRSASGIVTRNTITGSQLTTAGIDSIPTRYFYNTSTSRYTHSRYDIDLGGFPYSDSTVYAYNAAGQIITVYSFAGLLGFYEPASRTEYLYDANGNMTSFKFYNYDPSTTMFELENTITMTYDDKTNPIKIGVESVLFALVTYAGNNNAKTYASVDLVDPSQNFNRTYTYTYNSASKPISGTVQSQPSNTSGTSRFYYN